MFTNTIGRWGRSATQRPAPQAPAPRKHARNGRQALDGLKHEAPVEPQREPYIPPPFSPEMHEDLERWVERLLNEAADLDNEALRLMDLAQKRREKAEEAERLVWLVRTVPGQPAKPTVPEEQASPEKPVDQEAPPALAGDLCFGCKRSRDTLPCYSALEGREVPLCPRCHPSADDVDDTGADGEEPETVETPAEVLHYANDAYLPICGAHSLVDSGWTSTPAHENVTCPDCLKRLKEFEEGERNPTQTDLPEALVSEPFGPAAVPQLVADRAKSAYGRYVIGDGETRTDIPAVNGADR